VSLWTLVSSPRLWSRESCHHRLYFAELGMKRHNLQPSFRESSDSLRQQAASTNLPMPFTPASGNGVYALALCATLPTTWCFSGPFVA